MMKKNKKDILFTKSQLKKLGLSINEAPIDYGDQPERMDPTLQNRLETGDVAGAGSEAYPDVDRDGIPDTFEELIASKRFRDVVEKVKHYTGVQNVSPQSFMQLQQMLMGAVQNVFRVEAANKEALEELAVKMVREEMSIPEDALQFDAKIVGMGEIDAGGMNTSSEEQQKQQNIEQQMKAEEEAAAEFEDFDIEKQKRRFLNQLIQGASKKGHYMFHLVEEELNKIDPNLINLYGVMMSINDLVYWIMPDQTTMMMAQSGESMAGKEEVDPETDPPTIKARGISFPVLVHELIKGVMEVLATQGLPDDPNQAQMVMDAEDTLTSEVWDLRLGPVIWEKFRDSYPSKLSNDDMIEIQNYLFSEFARMEATDMFRLSKEILSGTPEGKQEMEDLVQGIIDQLSQEDYEDSVSTDYEEESDTIEPPRRERTTPSREPQVELDVDTILDKISSSGMGSLTKRERDFLNNLNS